MLGVNGGKVGRVSGIGYKGDIGLDDFGWGVGESLWRWKME